jgi:hypothetical protein
MHTCNNIKLANLKHEKETQERRSLREKVNLIVSQAGDIFAFISLVGDWNGNFP